MLKGKKYLIILLTFLIIAGLVISQTVIAQLWTNLPPYNILWPLWSPTLSPPDPVTGVPTPLISELSSSTILPVQPVLGMNPYTIESPMGDLFPYLFYNSAVGVQFFDLFYGLNPWPPPNFLDAAGAPVPLALPIGWSYLAVPTWRLSVEYQYLVDLANLNYLIAYGNGLGIAPSSLLTFADIWGLPAI
jgi:hypothetical protein